MKTLLLCSLLLGLAISKSYGQYGIPEAEDDDDLYPPASMAQFVPPPLSTAGITYTKYEDEEPVVIKGLTAIYDIRRASPMPAYTSAPAAVSAPVIFEEEQQQPLLFAVKTPENPTYGHAAPVSYVEPATNVRFQDYSSDYNIRSEAVPIVKYVMDSDTRGSYHLETVAGNGITATTTGQLKDLGGNEGPVVVKFGSYSYTGDDGKFYQVNWKADEGGFQAFGDHLP